VLKRIFRPTRDKVMGEWRKLHNGELHNLYSPPNNIMQIKLSIMRGGRACGMHRRGQESVHDFGGKDCRKDTTQKIKV
jgi:hypothetical protein